MVQPQVMVRDAHLMECHLLCILEETVRSPDVMQPLHIQNSVVLTHVFWQSQPGIPPALCQEDVSNVGL
jgi:hypothetical protein